MPFKFPRIKKRLTSAILRKFEFFDRWSFFLFFSSCCCWKHQNDLKNKFLVGFLNVFVQCWWCWRSQGATQRNREGFVIWWSGLSTPGITALWRRQQSHRSWHHRRWSPPNRCRSSDKLSFPLFYRTWRDRKRIQTRSRAAICPPAAKGKPSRTKWRMKITTWLLASRGHGSPTLTSILGCCGARPKSSNRKAELYSSAERRQRPIHHRPSVAAIIIQGANFKFQGVRRLLSALRFLPPNWPSSYEITWTAKEGEINWLMARLRKRRPPSKSSRPERLSSSRTEKWLWTTYPWYTNKSSWIISHPLTPFFYNSSTFFLSLS